MGRGQSPGAEQVRLSCVDKADGGTFPLSEFACEGSGWSPAAATSTARSHGAWALEFLGLSRDSRL